MDGLAAVVAIRAFEAEDPSRRHKLPIIACTAHNEKVMESNIYASGMQVSSFQRRIMCVVSCTRLQP